MGGYPGYVVVVVVTVGVVGGWLVGSLVVDWLVRLMVLGGYLGWFVGQVVGGWLEIALKRESRSSSDSEAVTLKLASG